MATYKGGAAIIDIENEAQRIAEAQLQFQDYPSGEHEISEKPGQTHTFSNFPDSAVDGESADLLGESEKTSAPIWSLQYYQTFFNVDTDQVLQRLFWSFVPKSGPSYLDAYIRPNPDLYGPFWICATLVFVIGIAGNMASYLQNADQEKLTWHYDFHKVTLAATVVYLYALLVPSLVWGLFWYYGTKAEITFVELLCIFGYSLSIFVPVSALWVVDVELVQWILGLLATVMSLSVLLQTFWPILRNQERKVSFSVVFFLVTMHSLLALGFVLYFFHHSKAASTVVPPPILSTTLKRDVTSVVTNLLNNNSSILLPNNNNSSTLLHNNTSTS